MTKSSSSQSRPARPASVACLGALRSSRSLRAVNRVLAVMALLSVVANPLPVAAQSMGTAQQPPPPTPTQAPTPSAPSAAVPAAPGSAGDANGPMTSWPSTFGQPPAAAGPPKPAVKPSPAGSLGSLPPTQKVKVDVWDLDPEAQELHLDIKDNVLSLTLEQAVDIGLQRNLSTVLQRYIRNEARLSVLAAYGIYDLTLTGLAQANYQKSPDTSLSSAGTARQDNLNLGLSQLLPSGGTVSLAYNNPRTEEIIPGTTSSFYAFNGVYFWEPSATFTLSQPLLNGFGRIPTEKTILQARNGSDSNRCLFEFTAITNSITVIDDYWALVNAREQLVVAQEALQLARDLNERNRIQVQVGTLAPLEMAQSEAAIATDEENIITAQAAVGDAADALRQAMNLPPDLWHLDILPTTPPETDTIQIDLDSSIKTALENRVEIKYEVLKVDSAKVTAAVAHNAVLPTVNFLANYGLTGVGPSYGTAFSQLSDLSFPGWSIGLSLSVPLQNRAARATAVSSDLGVKQFSWELDAQRKQVLIEVRKAVRAMETATKQIDAAHAARQYQERSLDAERKRYENGMSTSFLITQVEEQLTTSKQTEVNAITTYRTALAEYYRSIGKLLPELGVQIQDPKEPVNRFVWHKADWWR